MMRVWHECKMYISVCQDLSGRDFNSSGTLIHAKFSGKAEFYFYYKQYGIYIR